MIVSSRGPENCRYFGGEWRCAIQKRSIFYSGSLFPNSFLILTCQFTGINLTLKIESVDTVICSDDIMDGICYAVREFNWVPAFAVPYTQPTLHNPHSNMFE